MGDAEDHGRPVDAGRDAAVEGVRLAAREGPEEARAGPGADGGPARHEQARRVSAVGHRETRCESMMPAPVADRRPAFPRQQAARVWPPRRRRPRTGTVQLYSPPTSAAA